MMSHGYTVQEEEDPIVNLVDVATEQFSEATRPGAFLVDVLPVLRYVPSWFPGAGFQKIAVSWSKTANDMADIPHDFVKQQMVSPRNEYRSLLFGLMEGVESEWAQISRIIRHDFWIPTS